MIWQVLASWTMRRWTVAAVVALIVVAGIGIPTALIDTPIFGREIPAPWWAWPALLLSAVLSGLLTATYVAPPAGLDEQAPAQRGGWAGAVLTFFAVGCPVCNKLVLLALGSAGAIAWFEPLQPVLQLLAVVLLGWALQMRLRGEIACRTRALRLEARG